MLTCFRLGHLVFLSRQNVGRLRGIVGTNNLRDGSGTPIRFDRAIIHESYNSYTVRNDIGLLRTTRAISSNRSAFVNSICLPSKGENSVGSGIITGYGYLREGGPSSPLLMTTSISIQPDSQCRQIYRNEYSVPEMLCAGERQGGKDTCQGDSGGPMAQRTSSGAYVLIGITSFGRGCARANTPGVYTRVSNYVDWIQQKVANT